jgi:hypothetical protein
MGPLGGKTVAALWDDFKTTYPISLAWLQEQGFVGSDGAANPEALLDALDVTRREWLRISSTEKLRKLDEVLANIYRAVIQASILQSSWWANPEAVSLETPELHSHRQLLQKLTSARQPGQPSPWVFTTNYDLAIEWAAEPLGLKVTNGFDGLHRRTFSPHNFDLGFRNVLARGEARFGTYNIYLAKLHGSLSWHGANDEEEAIVESPTRARWPAFESFLGGGIETVPGFLVLPTAAKYVQTIGFILGELVRRFSEFLSRPQSCLLISGYSFSDDHVNRVLATALQNPTLHLVIYLPEFKVNEGEPDSGACKPWVQKVVQSRLPQVTLVGGGSRAFLDQLAKDLPEGAVFDDQALQIRKLMTELRQMDRPDGDG